MDDLTVKLERQLRWWRRTKYRPSRPQISRTVSDLNSDRIRTTVSIGTYSTVAGATIFNDPISDRIRETLERIDGSD